MRVPDGIVIASDSLSTFTQPVHQKVTVKGKCKKCGEITEIKDAQVPPVSVPSSTWPYTQKLFPVKERFGLATHGWGFVNNRSIYNNVIDLVPNLPEEAKNQDYFQVLSDFIVKYFHDQLVSYLSKIQLSLDLQPDDWFPFVFNSLDSRVVRTANQWHAHIWFGSERRPKSNAMTRSAVRSPAIQLSSTCSGTPPRTD